MACSGSRCWRWLRFGLPVRCALFVCLRSIGTGRWRALRTRPPQRYSVYERRRPSGPPNCYRAHAIKRICKVLFEQESAALGIEVAEAVAASNDVWILWCFLPHSYPTKMKVMELVYMTLMGGVKKHPRSYDGIPRNKTFSESFIDVWWRFQASGPSAAFCAFAS